MRVIKPFSMQTSLRPKLPHLVLLQINNMLSRSHVWRMLLCKKTSLFIFFIIVITMYGCLQVFTPHSPKPYAFVEASGWKPRVLARHNNMNPRHIEQNALWNNQALFDSVKRKPQCVEKARLRILITSAVDHQDRRSAIRNTWCSSSNLHTKHLPKDTKNLMQCVFLIGTPHNAEGRRLIEQEMTNHSDILYGNYQDTYRNLTLKVLNGLYWAEHDCPSSYVLKTDDDCFVNTNVLLRLLLAEDEPNKPVYLGNNLSSLKHTKVIRDPSSKWAVSESEYAPDYYPSYISGTGYLLSRHSVKGIIQKSASFLPFPVEDAYIGVLAEQAGITPEHTYRFTLITSKWDTCNFMWLILLHNIMPERQREMQSVVQKAQTECTHHKFITTW